MKKDQAERHNQGKPKLSMVLEMPHALEGVARVLEYGAAKYARGNYKLGLPWTEVADSLLRHTLAWLNGEDTDAESGLPHVGHMNWNTMVLAEYARTRTEFDDRCGGRVEGGRMAIPPEMAKMMDDVTESADGRTIQGSVFPGPGGNWRWVNNGRTALKASPWGTWGEYEVSMLTNGPNPHGWRASRCFGNPDGIGAREPLGTFSTAEKAMEACARDEHLQCEGRQTAQEEGWRRTLCTEDDYTHTDKEGIDVLDPQEIMRKAREFARGAP
jgi:hypothetical protein